MRLNISIVQRLLPPNLYQQLIASDIAKRFVHGSVWSILGGVTSRLLVLVGMIILARILGQKEFGEFGMVQSTMVVAGMMAGFGLGSTVTRFVAQFKEAEPERTGRIIGLIVSSSLTLIFAVGVITVFGSRYLATVVLNAEHLQIAIIIGTLLMMAITIRGIQSGILAGMERFDVIAKLNIFEGLTSLLAVVLMAKYFGVEGGLLGFALAIFVTMTVGLYPLFQILRAHQIKVTYRGSWQEKQILTSYSLPNFLANSLVGPVIWYCMTMITKRVDGYEDLALYHAAYQWHGPIMFIPLLLNSVSMPILVQQWESGAIKKFRKIFFWNASLLLAISVLPVLIVSMLSPWIMSFYGQSFRDGWQILILLVAAAPMNAMARMGTTALFGMHRAWAVFWLNVIWSVVMLSMTMALMPQLGVLGLASSFLTAYIALMFLTTFLVIWYIYQAERH